VSELVGNVLDTPLEPKSGLSLRAIAAGDRLNELEFHYPLARMDAPGLRSVLARFAAYRGAAEGLRFDPARGLMRGFIDLVFRHRGRYYIADYKSNYLGDRLLDYGPAGITAAMASHRYDLQYLVYTLALRRYLGSRLPDYDYRRHFGGVYYLFLRGMRPDAGPRYGVHFGRPEPVVVEALDALCAGSRP